MIIDHYEIEITVKCVDRRNAPINSRTAVYTYPTPQITAVILRGLQMTDNFVDSFWCLHDEAKTKSDPYQEPSSGKTAGQ